MVSTDCIAKYIALCNNCCIANHINVYKYYANYTNDSITIIKKYNCLNYNYGT